MWGASRWGHPMWAGDVGVQGHSGRTQTVHVLDTKLLQDADPRIVLVGGSGSTRHSVLTSTAGSGVRIKERAGSTTHVVIRRG